MSMNSTYLNAIADNGATLVSYVSLADGPLEADEIVVTRQSITWGTAASGNVDSTNAPEFSVPSASTVNNIQYWSAATGGTFYGSSSVTSETFSGAGTYTLSAAAINHNAV